MQIPSLGREDPVKKEVAATPGFLPEESHGQRSLMSYMVYGVTKESDMT